MTAKLKTTRAARRRLLGNLVPRERLTPSQWAEKYRVLTDQESNTPGPYTFDKTPYWRAVIDATVRRGVEEIVCLKGHQSGWSETCRNMAGFWIDLQPGPVLVLMPDENAAEQFRAERIEPLMTETPAVAQHVSKRKRDATKYRIRFTSGCNVYFAWAGSKSGTKSRPIRRLICEEPDEYPPFSSTGGDPLSKAEKRLTTYRATGRSTLLLGGTPTTKKGNVWKRWELCAARYHFWVPCPHCGGFQTMVWGTGKGGPGVKWPAMAHVDRSKRAEAIKFGSLAFYQCEYCPTPIHDHHKPAMLKAGLWATEDQAVTRDGRIVGPEPEARRLGFKVSSLYSPFITFGELAAEWLESQGDPNKLADFVNQDLAEPWEEQRAKTDPSVIAERAAGAPKPMVVPAWARWLIATADTQGDDEQRGHFWYTIRAWACEYRSQLVDFGVCHSKGELIERCFERAIPVDGGGTPVVASKLFIDSGGKRWLEVYEMAQADDRIIPTKGASKPMLSMVAEKPQKGHNVTLWLIDTQQAKDHLHRLIHDPDRTRWMVHREVNADYCSQMASEVKTFDPKENRELWVTVNKQNHLWDCEALQAAAAFRLGFGQPEPQQEPEHREDPGDPQGYRAQPAASGSFATGFKGRY
jgi:phage terminase large subunit GpA-like protein